MLYSQGGTVESEVIYVGQGKSDEDYEGKEVKDKLVFAVGGNSPKVYRQAVLKRQAAGVIVGPSDRDDRLHFTDLIEVGRISPTAEELKKTRFGFSISRRQENELLPYFQAEEKVIMKAKVDAELIVGDMPVIEAKIIGQQYPSQEIILMGHLDHYKPGANDNASGCAGMVEIIRNIRTLVERGDIPPIKRTIRFLFVPEIHGAIAYLSEHEDLKNKGIVGMNLDMIGEDYALCQATFNITCAPYSVPGYINDVLVNLLPWLEEDGFYESVGSRNNFNYRIKPHSGGSDHMMFNDATFSIPSPMLGHNNVFHHTNLDSPKTCDPTEMKRIISLAEAASILISNAGDEDALEIAHEVYGQACSRMSKRTEQSLRLMRHIAKDPASRKRLAELHWKVSSYALLQAQVESKNILKVKELCQEKTSQKIITKLSREITKQSSIELKKIDLTFKNLLEQYSIEETEFVPSENFELASNMIPERLFKGPLVSDYDRQRFIWDEIREHVNEERAKWYDENKKEAGRYLSSKIFEIVNLMDGKRTISDIRNIVSCEYDETSITFMLRFMEDLEKLGLIKLNRTES
jgi:hypothetical protein